jgi:hypothetical protein
VLGTERRYLASHAASRPPPSSLLEAAAAAAASALWSLDPSALARLVPDTAELVLGELAAQGALDAEALDLLLRAASQPVATLDLFGVPGVSDAWLRDLPRGRLSAARLGGASSPSPSRPSAAATNFALTDRGIEALASAHCGTLTSLEASGLPLMTTRGMATSLEMLRGLKRLRMERCGGGEGAALPGDEKDSAASLISALARLTSLTELSLHASPAVVTPAGSVKQQQRRRTLDGGFGQDDDALVSPNHLLGRALARMRRLQILDLGWCSAVSGDEDIIEMVTMMMAAARGDEMSTTTTTRGNDGNDSSSSSSSTTTTTTTPATATATATAISELDLSGTRVGDAALAAVARGMPLLTRLAVAACPGVSALGIRYLAGMRTATASINNNGSAAAAAALSALTSLDISRTPRADDASIAALALLPSLRRLDASFTGFGDRAAVALASGASRASLSVLRLEATDVGDVGVAALATLRRLCELDLSDCARVTDAGVLVLVYGCSVARAADFGSDGGTGGGGGGGAAGGGGGAAGGGGRGDGAGAGGGRGDGANSRRAWRTVAAASRAAAEALGALPSPLKGDAEEAADGGVGSGRVGSGGAARYRGRGGPRLTSLDISFTSTTDASLRALAACDTLQRLRVDAPGMSDAGVSALVAGAIAGASTVYSGSSTAASGSLAAARWGAAGAAAGDGRRRREGGAGGGGGGSSTRRRRVAASAATTNAVAVRNPAALAPVSAPIATGTAAVSEKAMALSAAVSPASSFSSSYSSSSSSSSSLPPSPSSSPSTPSAFPLSPPGTPFAAAAAAAAAAVAPAAATAQAEEEARRQQPPRAPTPPPPPPVLLPPPLVELEIGSSCRVGDMAMSSIAAAILPNLTSLEVSTGAVGEAGVAALCFRPSSRSSGSSSFSRSLPSSPSPPSAPSPSPPPSSTPPPPQLPPVASRLRRLAFPGSARLGDGAVRRLASAARALTSLDLSGTGVTASGLGALAALSSLEHLVLTRTPAAAGAGAGGAAGGAGGGLPSAPRRASAAAAGGVSGSSGRSLNAAFEALEALSASLPRLRRLKAA